MSQFNIAETKTHFSALVQKALLGEEVVITHDSKPILKLVPVITMKQERTPGSVKGKVIYVAPDFDATSEKFQDYA